MLLDAFKLTGKTALVTGAGKGIGRAIALSYAQLGANVIGIARNQEELDSLAEEVRSHGVKALMIACDITDQQQVDHLPEKISSEFDALDILVNNAGAAGRGWGSLDKVDRRRFEDTLTINLTSAYSIIHGCLPLLRKGREAAIINVSSALSWMVDKNFSAYAAAKAGMNQMTKVMAYELAPEIRVNGIAPGAVDTPSTAFIKQNEAMHKATTRWIPLQRMGEPMDIAWAAVYLASSASAFVSGKILEVDGGMQALPGSAIEANIHQQ